VDVLEIYQDKVEAKSWLAAQIREEAEAFLEGRPWPEWPDRPAFA